MLQQMGLNKNKSENKAFTPKMVRDLLNVDNERIIKLCKKVSLIPKKNSKGQTYFSRDDVRILKRVQDLQNQAMQKAQQTINNRPQQPQTQTQMIPVAPVPPQPVVDAKLTQAAIDTIERLNKTLNILEDNLSRKLTSVLDEKLDGMDEVVVELIRSKTENENLRHKINELNKENFYLKNNLNSYKDLGFGLYTIKQLDNEF